jgi:hypothetical protein
MADKKNHLIFLQEEIAMKKFIKLVLIATALVFTTAINAETYNAPSGSKIFADKSGKISWSGVQVDQVVHFKQEDPEGTGWLIKHSVGGARSFTLPNVAKDGGRFQLKLNGKWLLVTPEGVPGATLHGVGPICDDPQGCALGISGTRAAQGPEK